jgi:hypothetical protein
VNRGNSLPEAESPKGKGPAPWIVLVVASVLAGLLVAILVQNNVFTPRGTPVVTPEPATPTPAATSSPPSDVQPAELGYLRLSSELTKIYLVSANTSYEAYPEDLIQQWNNVTVVHKGEPCFVLNLTLRNDYALNDDTAPAQKIPIMNYTGTMWMTLSVALFDKTGNRINATDITYADTPMPSAGEFGVHNGETGAVDVVLATQSRNIDHYNVTLGYLGILPYP